MTDKARGSGFNTDKCRNTQFIKPRIRKRDSVKILEQMGAGLFLDFQKRSYSIEDAKKVRKKMLDEIRKETDVSKHLPDSLNISTIIPNKIYLSGYTYSPNDIKQLKINAIINCANCVRDGYDTIEKYEDSGMKYIFWAIRDSEKTNIFPYFIKICDKLCDKKGQEKKEWFPVLIHCKFGVNRSASLLIAYLMKIKKMSLKEAYKFVWERRNSINPLDAFFKQLMDWEKYIKIPRGQKLSKTI